MTLQPLGTVTGVRKASRRACARAAVHARARVRPVALAVPLLTQDVCCAVGLTGNTADKTVAIGNHHDHLEHTGITFWECARAFASARASRGRAPWSTFAQTCGDLTAERDSRHLRG